MITIFKKTSETSSNQLLRQYEGDAGLDIVSAETKLIWPGGNVVFKTALSIAIPSGYFGMIKARSGLSVKHNIEVGAGVIDAGYRGEVHVHLYNFGITSYRIQKGDKIAQLLVLPVVPVEVVESNILPESHDGRGNNGFGSTGI